MCIYSPSTSFAPLKEQFQCLFLILPGLSYKCSNNASKCICSRPQWAEFAQTLPPNGHCSGAGPLFPDFITYITYVCCSHYILHNAAVLLLLCYFIFLLKEIYHHKPS
ncbi:hypothetical protein GDO81_030190 [Engystomops pustulosus]|uniref:Uncharacterized protein n=1 Tax=Engystomops pustulosus TaxID=76066 RepID=A0AAV6ZKR5_ENGPU|nr:hypothetical protein GDO81_030190 [Engystomops pustulosus]